MLKNNKRWIIGALMFFGIVINYMDRVNISHAILQIKAEFHLTSLQQGIILSSFSWGYVLFMLVGGYLVDKKGSRIMQITFKNLFPKILKKKVKLEK